MIKNKIAKFWSWYERNYTFNLGVAVFLLSLQIIHLYWLTADVVFFRIFGESFFEIDGLFKILIIFIDYLEIPALVSGSLIYINALRKNKSIKNLLFLIFLNSQWLHIFWITDEFVVEELTQGGVVWPVWLVWMAIVIDYFELPVIYDSSKRFIIRVWNS